MKTINPIVALVYDFDGTLSPGNMQEFGFIRALGQDAKEFWTKNTKMSVDNDASPILCYMNLMVREAREKGISLKRESFQAFGKDIEMFEGVKEWFSLVNRYGKERGLEIKHYINSSGMKEMIEGTEIAKEFEAIYACAFLYDSEGIAFWPGVAVDYTTKTQFLFKINKGIKSVSDNIAINEYVSEEDRPVPFKKMIYFGDGETDIPSMKLVKDHGGHSIAVYTPEDREKKLIAEKLILENRVNFVCPANYSHDKEIFKVVTTIIDKIKSDFDFENLEKTHKANAGK
ncbi:MAG: HAD family hydrolase [Bacteroidales bacterium]